MWLINLAIRFFSILKVNALECVSVVNQKCMPRPKILNVNEGIGEALFYPYNFQVNKCSGSCDTLDNPMSKICVPKIIKNVNMKVYNFLIRLNETRNVLWHESCKCVIRNLLEINFTVNPIRDYKYLVAKLKIFDRINRTTFNNNSIPMGKNHYICIPVIDIDSVLKFDKKAYLQAYLEQCKYKLKTRKIVNYIYDEIIDEDSDSDHDYNDTVM